MADRLEQMVWGAIAGATLGAPLRGKNADRSVRFYEPIPTRMAPTTACDAWLVALRHWNDGGAPEGLCRAYFDHWNYNAGESGFAQMNMRDGFFAPCCGSFRNPFAACSRGLGRALIWGLLATDATEAFRWGWYDGSFDHDPQTAIISGVIAAAAFASNTVQSASALVDLALANSSSSALVSLALKTAQKLASTAAAPATVLKLDAPQAPNSALKTLVAIFYSLLVSQGTFEAVVTTAATSSDDPETAAMITGALACGLGWPIPSEWKSPIDGPYCAGFGLREIEPPATIKELEQRIRQASLWPTSDDAVAEKTAPTEASEEEQIAIEAPKPWWDGSLWGGPNSMLFASSDLKLKLDFVNGPAVFGDHGLEVVATVQNATVGDLDVTPKIDAKGGDVAVRLESFRLRSGASHAMPMVFGAGVQSAELDLNGQKFAIPIVRPAGWMQCGPFAYADGDTLEKPFKCEDTLDRTTIFSGRSQIGVKWVEAVSPGIFFDLEQAFGGMAGVIYLAAKVRFPNPGKMKLIFMAKPGGLAIINRERAIRYLDSLEGPRQPNLENTATFTVLEENTILIKVIRQREPLGGPITLYFQDESGEIVKPEYISWT